jgi:hypothetical protein
MTVFDNLRNGVRAWLGIDGQPDARVNFIKRNKAYVDGDQKKMLKVKPGNTDDNVTVNIMGLIVDRWVSWLFGNEIEFDLPGEDESAEQKFIDETWAANRKDTLLHKAGSNGAIAGTTYLKIVPKDNGIRLIALDPQYVTIDTDPEDVDTVIRYTIQYNVDRDTVKEISEIVDGRWVVTRRVKRANQPETVEDMGWQWTDFAPIVHCQNLPCSESPYGVPEFDETSIRLQDSINFVASNINKANRLHAAPQIWGKNLPQELKAVDVGPSQMLNLGQNGEAGSFQMSEMTSSQFLLMWLVKQLYITTRTIDLDSLSDKLGNITNFGLRVLYEDTLTKLATKRQLYGEMLNEVNRRMLIIKGLNPDPGDIHWKDIIPQNKVEEANYVQALLNMGVLSKESAALQLELDYTAEQDKIAADKTNETNIGAALLSAFNRSGQNQ